MLPKYFLLMLISALMIGGCGNKSHQSDPQNISSENLLAEVDKTEKSIIKNSNLPDHIINQLQDFKELVRRRDSVKISELAELPLKRPNQLISTKEEFEEYFPLIFDENLCEMILKMKITYKDLIVRSDDYGILSGELWFRNSGQLFAINYKTPIEEERLILNQKAIKNQYHESVPDYDQQILRFETEKYFISILTTNEDDIYASWKKPKSITDKPDLILRNGVREFMGSMGGYEYSFNNGIISYIITKYNLGPDDDLGIRLMVKQAEKIILEEKAIRKFE